MHPIYASLGHPYTYPYLGVHRDLSMADRRRTVGDWLRCAGLAARMSTQMRREREEQQRLMQEEADFERIMSLNLGPMKSLDDEQEVA